MFNRFSEEKSISGVWCVYDGDDSVLDMPEAERPEFLIARAGGSRARKGLLSEREHMIRGKRNKELTSLELNELSIQFLLKYVLLGWRNVCDWESGKDIPFSTSTAREMLDEDTDFRTWVDTKSNEAELYYRDRVGNSEAALKNKSGTDSAIPLKMKSNANI